MKASKSKCHLFISGSENITINVDGNMKEKIPMKKSLVLVDYNLKFNRHLDSVLKKPVQKVNSLSRILPYYMNFEKRRILMNRFLRHSSNVAL